MKLLLYIGIALVAFCGVVGATLYFGGALNKETLDSIRGSDAGQGEQSDIEIVSEESRQLTALATALRDKENQLAQREEDIAKDEKRLEQERKEFESFRKEIDALLKRMGEQVDILDAEKEKELLDLAKTYEGMDEKKAGEILSKMPLDDAVSILKRINTRKRGPIVQEMDNAGAISEAILKESGD